MNERSVRLRVIFDEMDARSVTWFAKKCGVPQKSMDNYIKGLNEPKIDALMKVVNEYPYYNFDWLAYGNGEKYNPNYVTNSDDANLMKIERANQDQDKTNSNELADEIKKSRDRIVSRTIRKLNSILENQNNTSVMGAYIKELIEDLKDELK